MAYIDVAGKTILEAWGKFKGKLYATVVPGDLLNRDTSNDAWILATASLASDAVALEKGVSGDTIWMALAVVIEAPPSESGGAWSAGAVATSGTECDPIYGAAAGKASSSATGISQRVGFILSTSRAVLCPSTYLTSTNLSLSGNLAVTGTAAVGSTLAVTGITTLTGLLNADGGIAVATNKFTVDASGNTLVAGTLAVTGTVTIGTTSGLVMAIKTYTSAGAIVTTGFVGLSNTAADMAMTLAAPTAGSLLIISDTSASGTKVLTVKSAGTFDGSNNTLTFNAPGESIVLFAVTTALWIIVENIGSVGLSST